MGHSAVVEGEVGDDAGLLIRAIGEDEGTFVRGMVNETTLLAVSMLDLQSFPHFVVVPLRLVLSGLV